MLDSGGAPADIVVERSMYFPDATRTGGHNASGVTTTSERWVLAEGASTIFNTFILVTNPNASAVNVRVSYLRSTGAPVTFTEALAPNSRRTFWPQRDFPGDMANAEFSTVVESLEPGKPIVAERAMYFSNGSNEYASGHDALGVAAPSTTWYFAEGNTGGNAAIAFETFLLLANQNETATQVTVTYQLDSGVALSRVYDVQARQRFTVWVDAEAQTEPLLRNAAFGISVLATQPIVAERAMYWGTPSTSDVTEPRMPWAEGHATAGAPERASAWAFAEGAQDFVDATGLRYQTFLLLSNPNPTPIVVEGTFLREGGGGIQRYQCVPANGRANIWTAVYPELSNRKFASLVQTVATAANGPCGVATTGGEAFVAERAMYWGEAFSGGHVNIGTPWTGVITAPPPPADVLTASVVAGAAGRLSGGDWIEINVSNAAVPDTEVLVGGLKAPEVQFLSGTRIRVRTPLRTAATGYGSAGPRQVIVNNSRGQSVSAGTMTVTFRVLAFGDSITWGTFNVYFPETGQKVAAQVNGPYPLVLKNLLNANGRFGSFARVMNAGIPGEQATGGGETRLPRCLSTGPIGTCGHVTGIVPGDFARPFDVVIIFEGINDLIWGRTPARARDALRTMVLSAKAAGVPVILGRFDSFRTNNETGYWTGLNESVQLANLTEALAVEQGLARIRFDGISMSWDGLHPDQIGYDRMASLAAEKLLAEFPVNPTP